MQHTTHELLLPIFIYQQLDVLIKRVEQDLVDCISKALLTATITVIEAKKTVSDFFSRFPIRNMQELVEKLYCLYIDHPFCTSIYLTYGRTYDESMSQHKATYVAECLQVGNINQGYAALKGGILW